LILKPASRRKSSTFQTMTISQRSMVSFPWKQNIKSSGSPSSSARQKKSGQPPRQKTHEPQEQRQFFNLQQKIKTKFWSCSRKLSTRADGGMFWFARLFLANLVCFVFKFPQTKDSENLSTISKKIVNPERRFVLPENTKHDGISCFQSPTWWARGGFKHRAAFAALSSRQSTRGQPTPQRRREEGLLDGGKWLEQKGCWEIVVAGNYDKNHLLENSRVRDVFRNLFIQSCWKLSTVYKKTIAGSGSVVWQCYGGWSYHLRVFLHNSAHWTADHFWLWIAWWMRSNQWMSECLGGRSPPVDTEANISPDEHFLLY